jgi:hypothetical protein
MALALLTSAIAVMTAGCATEARSGSRRGAAVLDYDPYGVTGRDLGDGGATSGGISSLDPTGNAADYSLYEEAQMDR